MKKYLLVWFVSNNQTGEIWENELKLSEAYLISKIAQRFPHKRLNVELREVNPSFYKSIFG